MANNNVCSLVVTYNRCAYLEKLLNALISQTFTPNKIVVFDNCSTDETQELLVKQRLIDNPLPEGHKSVRTIGAIEFHCIRNVENTGGSGGFHDGIEYARSLGCEYIWAMDDDVLPAPDCLEKLVVQMTPERRICIPNRTTEGFVDNVITHVDMSNPFSFNVRMRKSITPATQITDEVTLVEDMPFEGPLIDSSLVDEIGLPNKDLFIIFDDSEYCMRALKRTTVGFVRSAHLYKQIVPKIDHSKLMGWKEYYAYRNQYWFDRTYGDNVAVKALRPFLSRCDLTLRAIVRRKWSNIHVVSRAYDDGIHGRLGKLVEPGGRV